MVKAAATPSKSPAPAKKASTPAAQAQAAASSTPGRGHRRSHSQSDMAASPTATLTPNAASAAAASAARKRIRIESTETPTKSTKSPQNTAKNAVAKALPKRMVQADENEDDDDEEDDDTDLMALAADDDDDDDDDEAEADDDNDDDDDGDALDEASTDMDVSDANLDADLTDPRFVARRRAPLPTADEMRQLRESQSLYKGNLFRMQIEELLTQVKLNYSKHKTLEAALLSLKQQIESMPSDKSEREVSAADFAKLGVVPPLYATAASSIKFQFQTPSSFALVGSYNLRVLTKPNMTVDVAVEMPAGMFQAKDNINYRYHHKRALFLARIAARLKATAEFANVHFALAFDSDLSRPILSVRPQYAGTNQQSQFTIRIFPAVSAAVFKLSKLTPERNNARAFKIFGDDATAGGADADDANAGVPTPLYNSTILMDMMFSAHLAEIHAVLSQSTSGALSNGLVLFKVWLRVAHLDKHFSGLQAAFLLCYLYSGKRVTKFMTAIQVFRVMLEFIAQTDLTETPLAMPSNVDSKPDLALFQQVFPITLVDASGFLNVFYSISRSQYDEIRHQARIAASSFDAVGCDPYEILFQVRAQPEIKFDHTFVIHPLPGAAVTLASSTREVVQDAFLQANGNYAQHIAKTLHSLLVRGLSDRVQLVTVTPVLISADATQSDLQSTEWGCNEAGPAAVHLGAWDMAPFGSRKPSKANASSSASSSKGPSFALRVGIVAHSEQSLRVVDMGPSADDAEAAGAFRALWREKAELRRFKDGRVCEAVVWQSYPVSQRHLLVRDIVLHLAAVHLSLQGPQTSAPN
ncbi:hypothetical protein CAOG_08975, partial [Capsaspora owczarzaki ATCC 30864]|uniref:hypothetical protein n=1 Tax=Capsaspora owczarzaki (strain ATCC 30864) TaxID=595528 RepID=UPI0003521761